MTNGTNYKKVNVLIIGAGAAGLQCASKLLFPDDGTVEGEMSLMILEARNRVGGRIYTATQTATKLTTGETVSFPRDIGAAWLHGTGSVTEGIEDQNPMLRLLQETTPLGQSVAEYHLKPIFKGNGWTRPDTILHKDGRIALYRKGERIRNDSPMIRAAIERHYHIQLEIAKVADHLDEIEEGKQTQRLSMGQVRSELIETTVGEEKEDSSLVGDLVPFYAFLSENWHGISENDLQLDFVTRMEPPMQTDELYVDEGDYEGPHCKLNHGMEKVIEPLYNRVADRIHLNEQVMTVSRRPDSGVRIQTSSGLTVDADCCISTIPVGCLQKQYKTLFTSPLTNEAIEGIQSLNTGFYKKVFLTFDEMFWQTEEPVLGLVRTADQADEIGRYLLVYNFLAKDSIPCLEAILCGNSGKWAVSKSDDEIRTAVLNFIEDAMNVENLASKCVACDISRWEEDPFTLGAYSSYKLGTSERHVEAMQEPQWDGDLIIAGEFTEDEDMGSVFAALFSGERAALQVREALKKKV